METNKKELLLLDTSQIREIKDKFRMAKLDDTNSLFQIIHRYSGMNEEFLKTTLHYHNYYELEFVYAGSGTHILNKTYCKMSKGYVCLRTPLNIHSTIQDNGNPLKLYNIKFSEDLIDKSIAAHLISSEKSFWVTYDDGELDSSMNIMDRLFLELEHQDQFSLSIIKAMFTELFVPFVRKYHLQIESSHNESNHVQQAIHYINNNFRGDITLKYLAQKLYLTPNYLGEIFIKETGKTCSAYIQDLRFTLAIQLLINTDHSIQEISDECGFHSPSYFIRKFREKYGIPPLQYRIVKQEEQK